MSDNRETPGESAERLAKFILESRKTMTFDPDTSVGVILLLSGFACEIAKTLEKLGEEHGSNSPEAVAMRSEVRKIAAGLFDASTRCKGIVDRLNLMIAAELNETPPATTDTPTPPSETIH